MRAPHFAMRGFLPWSIVGLLLAAPAWGNEASEIHYSKALLAVETGRLDEASDELLEAEKADPKDPKILFEMGVVLNRQGKEAQAIPRLEAVRRLVPSFPGLHYEMGRAYLSTGRTTEALLELEAARIEDPKRAAVYLYLGQAQEKVGQNEQAGKSYQRAATLSVPLAAQAHARAGRLALVLGHRDRAERELEAALQASPDPRLAAEVRALLAQTRVEPPSERLWTATVGLSEEVDSNPLLLGTDIPVRGMGVRTVVTPSGTVVVPLAPGLRAGVLADFYQSLYESKPTLKGVAPGGTGFPKDLAVENLSLGPVLSYRPEGLPLGFELRHAYAHAQFADVAFTDSNTINLNVRLAEGASLLSELTGELADLRFDACARQGTCGRTTRAFGSRTAGFWQYLLFRDQRGLLRVGGTLESYEAPPTLAATSPVALHDDEWSYWGGTIAGLLSVPLPGDLTLLGSADWTYKDYFRQMDPSLARPSIHARRRDQATDAALSLQWQPIRRLSVQATYAYSANRTMGGIQTNPAGTRLIAPGIYSVPYADTYTYARNIVSVGIRAQF